MAPTRALINSYSSQHPQHASTGINSSEKKKGAGKAGFSIQGILMLRSCMSKPISVIRV